jgi:thymidine phosphorylase
VTREVGHLAKTISATRGGKVIAIDNLQMARLARLAGAPMDVGAGVYLSKKVGDSVQRDEPLYTIYADFGADFGFAVEAAEKDSGFRVE